VKTIGIGLRMSMRVGMYFLIMMMC